MKKSEDYHILQCIMHMHILCTLYMGLLCPWLQSLYPCIMCILIFPSKICVKMCTLYMAIYGMSARETQESSRNPEAFLKGQQTKSHLQPELLYMYHILEWTGEERLSCVAPGKELKVQPPGSFC